MEGLTAIHITKRIVVLFMPVEPPARKMQCERFSLSIGGAHPDTSLAEGDVYK
jgi:hypothetical protein